MSGLIFMTKVYEGAGRIRTRILYVFPRSQTCHERTSTNEENYLCFIKRCYKTQDDALFS